MKTVIRREERGLSEIFAIKFFLLVLIAAYVFAFPSPTVDQSGPNNQSNSKEDKNDREPEPEKVDPLGPADEFSRAVPRSSLKGYLKAARAGDFERAAKYLDLRYLLGRMDKSQGPSWCVS